MFLNSFQIPFMGISLAKDKLPYFQLHPRTVEPRFKSDSMVPLSLSIVYIRCAGIVNLPPLLPIAVHGCLLRASLIIVRPALSLPQHCRVTAQ